MEEKLYNTKFKHIQNNNQINEENKDLITIYNNYVNNITELFDLIMDKNNHLFNTLVFDILLEIGFFSYNNQFTSDKDDFKELLIKPGLCVVNGIGLCRNVACFYDDIFKNFYNYPLKLCCFDNHFNNDDDTKIYGNHLINLVHYHDNMYGFDNMNHLLFKAINENELNGIDIDYQLIYKPLGDILIRLSTELDIYDDYLDKIKLIKSILQMASKQKTISIEKYQELINRANDFIIQRKKIFKSFLNDNIDYKEKIHKKMLLLK